MIVKINGQPIEAHRIEVQQQASNMAAWMVIILGALACVGWWMLWA